MIYAGIDPGKKGGLSIIFEDGEIRCVPLSHGSLISYCKAFSGLLDVRFCLEAVHAMPKQGVRSTFTFGEEFGYIKGVLEAYGISYQEIPPERWKKEFGLNTDKKKSIEVCKALFPSVNLLATERSRVEHDGMAESLLLAEYGRRKL